MELSPSNKTSGNSFYDLRMILVTFNNAKSNKKRISSNAAHMYIPVAVLVLRQKQNYVPALQRNQSNEFIVCYVNKRYLIEPYLKCLFKVHSSVYI